MTLSAACRFNPVPPASEERKTLQSGLSVNSSMSACRFLTGTLPVNSTKGIAAEERCLPMSRVIVVHSLKITTLRPFRRTSSSRISASSSSFGDILVSRSIRYVVLHTWRIFRSSICMRLKSIGVRNFLFINGNSD